MPQHLKTCNRIPQRRSHKYVRRKMRPRRHPRKADHRRGSIRHPRHPPVMPVAPRHHRRNRKRAHGVPRRKTAAERRLRSVEKCVVERRSRRHIFRPRPPRNTLQRQVHNRAVRIRFARKQARLTRICIVPRRAHQKKRHRHERRLRVRNRPVKRVVEIVPIPCVRPKIRHRMWVSRNQPSRSRCHHQRGNPILPMR